MSTTKRPRALLFTILAVVVWLGIGGALGPVSGRLAEVQKNRNSEFLPENAESTRAAELLGDFVQGDSADLPLTVVFEKTGGALTDADKDDIDAAVRTALAKPTLKSITRTMEVNGATVPVVFPTTPEQRVLATSKDGEAYVVNVLLDAAFLEEGSGGFESIEEVALEAESVLKEPAPNVRGYVTGAVGIFAEFARAFAGIDGKLLLATVAVVTVILIIVYRSPFLWLFPLIAAGLSLVVAQGAIYWLAKHDILTLNGQSQGILTVLVFGAATDYALLLIARYREELRHTESKYDAMLATMKGVWEPIAASAGTVSAGLLLLQLSELKSNAGLGPVSAVGVVSALLVMLTFLPASLLLVGRKVFWPYVPRFGSEIVETKGLWGKVSTLVGTKPRQMWLSTTALLLILVGFAFTLKADGLGEVDVFTNKDAQALVGLQVLERHDLVSPSADATIVVKADALDETVEVASASAGVARVAPRTAAPTDATPLVRNGNVAIDVFLKPADSGSVQQRYIHDLRVDLAANSDAGALVGGQAAANLDVQEASKRDRVKIIPIVLAVIMLILMLLLRSILAPVLLIATVVLSFGATLGASAMAFNWVKDYPGADAGFPLFAFVFLVALGIDYNIFLMTRVREESLKLGTRAGTLKALAVTGGVITSAGIVLAATFAVLGVLPLLFLTQLGFAVAFGVLLDTIIVRSLLVPALAYELDSRIWWPSKLVTSTRSHQE